jgi:hypothetical protein
MDVLMWIALSEFIIMIAFVIVYIWVFNSKEDE